MNVIQSDWSVHFIGPDGKTRIGPWLLLDTHEEVLAILRWGGISAEELADHESSLRRWGCSSIPLMLGDAKLAALIERGRGWPWNGYELLQLKKAGGYPPERIETYESPWLAKHVVERLRAGETVEFPNRYELSQVRGGFGGRWGD